MRHVAAQIAAGVARQEQWQSPVILASEAKQDCRAIPNASSFDDRQILFVVTYAERSHSFCVTEYAPAVDGQEATTLSEESGRNYGAPIHMPVRVVPVGHVFKELPEFVVSLMDWKTKLPSSGGTIPFDSHTDASSAGPVSSIGLNINFFAIRASLARRHQRINWILDTALLTLTLVMLASAVWIWKTYRAFYASCAAYGYSPGHWQYLRENLDSMLSRIERDHRLALERRQAEARAADLARHTHEELRERLLALLESSTDDATRSEISRSLDGDNDAQIAALLHQLETRPKAPEARLTQLLEPLKEYCDAEEFQRHRAEALDTLCVLGFRSAREFVVRLYDSLKIAAKTIEDAERQETTDPR